VKPSAAQRSGARLGIVPITKHRHIAAEQDFARLAHRQVAVVVIDDAHADAGARNPGACQAGQITRVVNIGVKLLAHPDAGHRRLALAETLIEAVAEGRQRQHHVLLIHRRTAIINRLETIDPRLGGTGMVRHSRDHRRRSEERHVPIALHQRENFINIERSGIRHYDVRCLHQMR